MDFNNTMDWLRNIIAIFLIFLLFVILIQMIIFNNNTPSEDTCKNKLKQAILDEYALRTDTDHTASQTIEECIDKAFNDYGFNNYNDYSFIKYLICFIIVQNSIHFIITQNSIKSIKLKQ